MNKLFEKAQQFGKSFMLPIAILPVGLLLGIGGALSNPNTVKAYPFLGYYITTKHIYANVFCWKHCFSKFTSNICYWCSYRISTVVTKEQQD